MPAIIDHVGRNSNGDEADGVNRRHTRGARRSFNALDRLGVKLYDDSSHLSGVQP
jgi:hypothetical protein